MVGEIDAFALVRPLCDGMRLFGSLHVSVDEIDLAQRVTGSETVEGTADVLCEIDHRERLIVIAVFDGLAARLCVEIAEDEDRCAAILLTILCNALHNLLDAEDSRAVTDVVEVVVVDAEQLLVCIGLKQQALADTRAIALDRIAGARLVRCFGQPEEIDAQKGNGFGADSHSQTFAAEISITLIKNNVIIRLQALAQKINILLHALLEADNIRLFLADLLQNAAYTVYEAVDAVAHPSAAQIITDDL